MVYRKLFVNFVNGGYVPLSDALDISKDEFISLLDSTYLVSVYSLYEYPECTSVYSLNASLSPEMYRAWCFVVALYKS